MGTALPRVAVMILNFNGLRWLQICLPSVVKSTYQNADYYVIDNGSADGSVEFVKSNYPEVKLVRFDDNLGFAEAYNRAIASVDADYVVLLNNDTTVLNPAWIGALVARAKNGLSVAAVGCKLVTMDDHKILDSVGGMGIRYWRGFVDIGKNAQDEGQYDNPPRDPFAICGAAALIRRSDFLECGGFDSKFFVYLEDLDLSWRFRLRGLAVTYEPAAVVAHYYSGSGSKEVDYRKLYFTHRNLLRAILKNCGPSLGWALRNYLLFTLLLAAGFLVLDRRKTASIVKLILWNVMHFRDTYAWRVRIQGRRAKDETEILRIMYPSLTRHQPPEHPRLRRILNVLFEYSQQFPPPETMLPR